MTSKREVGIKLNSKYDYVIEDLRRNVFSEVVNELFHIAKAPIPAINERVDSRDECAKAFLIWLAVARFGISIEADIVLCHMGLLRGYSSIIGLQDRRKKFFIDSNYLFSGKKGSFNSLDLNEDELNYQASQFNKVDKPLLRKMMDYFDSLDDKAKGYTEACNRYLETTRNSHKVRQARLPRPSFAIKIDAPIKHIVRLDNPNFLGRADELTEIEAYFSSYFSKRVLVLYGMGGVGKTQIAAKYLYLHQQEYSTLLWLDASSIETLTSQCKAFLQEYTKFRPEDLQTGEEIKAKFRRFIGGRANSIIVFDDADYIDLSDEDVLKAQNDLASFMPNGNVKIIITTRNNRFFFNSKRMQVGTFTPGLAEKYLEDKTGLEKDEYSTLLVKKLGYLPLALDYAGSYIVMQQMSYLQYIELWEKHGSQLFDCIGYSEATIRTTFHLTLDKLKDVPLAMDFLQRIACLKAGYIPLKTYLKVVKKYPDAYFDGRVYDADGSYFYPIGAAKEDYLHKTLDNELERNELIHLLSQYSLIAFEAGNIYMHPLLAEIIFDEISTYDIEKWYGWSKTKKLLARIYEEYGDKESFKETLYSKVLYDLDIIRTSIIEIPEIAKTFRKRIGNPNVKMSGMENLLRDLYNVYEEILVLNDSELEIEAMQLRREIIPMLIAISDVDPCIEAVREIETDFLKSHPEKEVILR